jgi:hypothetical protein
MNLDYADYEQETGLAAHYREDIHGATVELSGGAEPCKTHFAPGREDSARICYQEALEMLKHRADDGVAKAKIEADIRELIESAKED